MKSKNEEKKMVRITKADGSKAYIAVEFNGKPDRLFTWNDSCRRGLGN